MTLSDIFNRMIEVALRSTKISSASPEKINTIISIDELEHTDIENEIRSIIEEEIKLQEIEATKASLKVSANGKNTMQEVDKKVSNLTETMDNLKKSPFGTMESLTRSQVSNIQGFSKDPFKFMFANFFKRFAKGAGIILLATIIFAAVQLIISELMKAGRLLDRRFRRVARDEILLFNSREVQAELRQGFRTVAVTTIPFLRGSQLRGQISGNLYNPTAIPMNRIDPRRVVSPSISTQNSSRASKFSNRRNSRFG